MKKLTGKLLAFAATAVMSCGLLSHQASAVPITGDIDFNGSASFDTTSLATATRVVSWAGTRVGSTTGSFSVIPFDNPATFTPNYVFNPSSPQAPLWTTSFGGVTFTFNLLTSTIVTQTATFLNVRGTGTVTGTGFDPTFGLWSFTSSKADGGNSSSFTFAANTSAIPEGGSAIALLGVALVGVEVLRRKLRTA
jgi:hypothetical protein